MSEMKATSIMLMTTAKQEERRLTPETLELLSGGGTKAVNIIAATVEQTETENEEMRWTIERRTKDAERPTGTHFKRRQPNTFVHGENKQETNQLQKSLFEQMTENHRDFHKQWRRSDSQRPRRTTLSCSYATHADIVCKMFCLFGSLCCLWRVRWFLSI